MVAGSILPVSYHNEQLFFLFGKENPLEKSAKGWSDFGGGSDGNETPLQTAIRESTEELTGFLGNKNQITQLLKRGFYKIVKNNYHIHIVLIPYDENLVKYFNNNHSFLWKTLDPRYLNKTKLFEKIEIKWFSADELITRRSMFRSFYRTMIDEIVENIPEIFIFCKKQHFYDQND